MSAVHAGISDNWHPAICADAWRVSHHEAGHALVGVVMGVPVHFATIIPDRDQNGRVRFGDASIYSMLVAVMAGPAADAALEPGWNHPMGSSDANAARDLIAQLPGRERASARMAARETAERLVRDHWRTIQRVANVLRVRGDVEGYIVEHFVKKG